MAEVSSPALSEGKPPVVTNPTAEPQRPAANALDNFSPPEKGTDPAVQDLIKAVDAARVEATGPAIPPQVPDITPSATLIGEVSSQAEKKRNGEDVKTDQQKDTQSAEDVGKQEPRENPTDARIERLTQDFQEALALGGDTPEREAKLLKLMDELEASKEELGLTCETIGEGRDRAIAMRIPVDRRLEEPALVNAWVTEYGYQREKFHRMGTMHRTRHEYMVVNRKGVLKVITTPDQRVDVDPNAAYFSARKDFTPENARDWVNKASQSVRWFAEQGQSRYQRLLDGHQFPASPASPEYTTDYAEAVRRKEVQSQQSRDWVLGSEMAPEGTWAKFIHTDDATFDQPGERTNPGQNWFEMSQHGYVAIRVTKPEFVGDSLKTNMHKVAPSVASAPQQPTV